MLQCEQMFQTRLVIAGEVVGLLRDLTRCSQWSSALAFEYRGKILSSCLCQLLATLNKITDKNIFFVFSPKVETELSIWSCISVVGLHR